MHGFKAHVGVYAMTAMFEKIAMTPANVNDGRAGPDGLPDNPREVFADGAYRGNHFRERPGTAYHGRAGPHRSHSRGYCSG